jgi:hypothetical protein
MKTEYPIRLGLISALLTTLFAAAIPTGLAFAGDCDDPNLGIVDTDIICTISDSPDDIGLDLGNDSLVVDSGVFANSASGDSLDDGSMNTGAGGNDELTINGDVDIVEGDTTIGNGGNDIIEINGNVGCVSGDNVDGKGGNDRITVNGDVSCSVSGDDASLDGGDDVIKVNTAGTVGDIYGDYAANGGDDQITVDGNASVIFGDEVFIGDGGKDTIIVNGQAFAVIGDSTLNGNGADDRIFINGFVLGVVGDGAEGNGGNDIIVIDGEVFDVIGDGTYSGDGGNDVITINGTVNRDILADQVGGDGGDDTVILGVGSSVAGVIDGEDGFDRLKFGMLRQSQLAGLDPALGSITIGGNTFYWFNFEQLIGLFKEVASTDTDTDPGFRVIYRSESLLAISELEGVSVVAEHGRIAFIAFSSLGDIPLGSAKTYSTPNSAGWYVIVNNLGPSSVNPAKDLYQVDIYSSGGSLQGSFSFTN